MAQTSLSKQLGALKLVQRDEIALPSRTKISFLFSVKQAANIDDQTLYYMCQSGLTHLTKEVDTDLAEKLSDFNDIFGEKALEFYRGGETAESLQSIDTQLETILQFLAPYLMEQSVHKIIEYLLRIFDIHVYHKATLVNAFFPYFETVFFLKMIQLLNLEKDQIYFFLHPFAHQGTALDKQTLVRALSRNNALIFTKYAEFAYKIPQSQSQSTIHGKFYGSMLVEVLKADSSKTSTAKDSQNTMFNLLPFISRSVHKSVVNRELKVSGLLAISQIACRNALTSEYTNAFVQQVIQVIRDAEFDDEMRVNACTILLYFTQYQSSSLKVFDKKCMNLLMNLTRVQKMVQSLSKNYDTSGLGKLLSLSFLHGHDEVNFNQMKPWLKSLTTNLKSVYAITELSVLEAVNQSQEQEKIQARARLILSYLQEVEPEKLRQSTLFLVRQLNNDKELKEKVLNFLSNEDKTSPLVVQFGEKEYSILSALSSTRRQTRQSALSAITADLTFAKNLSKSEQSLVKMALLQSISAPNMEEDLMLLALKALQIMIELGNSPVARHDLEFECISTLIQLLSQNQVQYSSKVLDVASNIAVSLKVESENYALAQAWMFFTFDKLQGVSLDESKNMFATLFDAVQTPNKKNKPDLRNQALVKRLVAMPKLGIQFLLGAFSGSFSDLRLSYINYNQVASLVDQVCKAVRNDLMAVTYRTDLFTQILKFMKKTRLSDAQATHKILLACLESLSAPNSDRNEISFKNCMKKWFSACLYQKHAHQELALTGLFDKCKAQVFDSDQQLWIEFLVTRSIESSCVLQRIYAIMTLTGQMKQGLKVCFKIMTGLCLILLNDEHTKIRTLAFDLLEAVIQSQKTSGEEMEIFSKTEKPTSTVKQPSKVTPMKLKLATQLLKSVLESKSAIIEDNRQLRLSLGSFPKLEVFEQLLRCLLDYPSFKCKQKFIDILTLVQSHAMTFAISLSQILNKIVAQLKTAFQKLDQTQVSQRREVEKYLCSVGELMLSTTLGFMQKNSVNSPMQEMTTSLIVPYLEFCCLHHQDLIFKTKNSAPEVKVLISKIFQESIFKEQFLTKVDIQTLQNVFRLFLHAEKAVSNGKTKNSLKILLIESGIEFQGSRCAKLVEYISESEDLDKMELLLETMSQLNITPSIKLLETSVNQMKELMSKFESADSATQASIAFTTELAVQLASKAYENLDSKGDKSVDIQESLVQVVSHIWTQIENTVAKQLSENQETEKDAFNQFMVQMDAQPEIEKNDDQLGLIQSVLMSCMGLLTTVEIKDRVSLNDCNNQLTKIAEFIDQLVNENDANEQLELIVASLFRVYESIVSKVCTTAGTKLQRFSAKDIFVAYLELVVNLCDSPLKLQSNIQEGRTLLRVVHAAGFDHYASLAIICLFAQTKKDQDIRLKEDLNIDCDMKGEGQNASLYLAKLILTHSLDQNQDLSILQQVLYSLHSIPFAESLRTIVEQKTELIFEHTNDESDGQDNMLNDLATNANWAVDKLIENRSEKKTRRFLFLSILLLNQWLSQSSMQHKMSVLTLKKTVQVEFMGCLLSSHILNASTQYAIDSKLYGQDKNMKASIQRLSKQIHSLQAQLNQMISLNIHVTIVSNILDFSHSTKKEQAAVLPLQTNCLQLLLDKISSFKQGFISTSDASLSSLFHELISKSVVLLTEWLPILTSSSTELSNISSLCQCLFTLFGRSACKSLNSDLQLKTLFIVQDYQRKLKDSDLDYLQLQSQLVITHYTFFEVYSLSFLNHFQPFFELTIAGLKSLSKESREEDALFTDTYRSALLKACVTIVQVFLKFLGAEQIEQIIVQTILASSQQITKANESDCTEMVLRTIAAESVKNDLKKVTMQASTNAFAQVTKMESSGDNSQAVAQAVRLFDQLMNPLLQNLPDQFLTTHHMSLLKFFKKTFKLIIKVEKLGLDYNSLTQSIVQCFTKFVLHLDEQQVRPLLVKLSKWGMKLHQEGQISISKATILAKLTSDLLVTLKELFVPLAVSLSFESVLIPLIKFLADKLCKQKAKVGNKRSREEASEPEPELEKLQVLLKEVCNTVKYSFQFDYNAVIQPAQFAALYAPVGALTSAHYGMPLADFRTFVNADLKQLTFAMVDRIDDESTWMEFNQTLVELGQNGTSPRTREAVLEIIEYLFENMRERYLVILNDTIPFLSEMLEDEDEKVEASAKRIVNHVEQLTGESINQYLK